MSFECADRSRDGNAVEFLVALKECLHHGIVPFIIEDSKKHFYYRELGEWSREKGWLPDMRLDGQNTVWRLLDKLGIPYDIHGGS